MLKSIQFRLLLMALAALFLAACAGGSRGDGPPSSGSVRIPDLPDDAIPRQEARSRYGNGPVYEVFGKSYRVMPSSKGYQERGVASWYGKKFHGNLTSNRERYDMYQMTAAHKTLPLPTYVRVRNLRNGKTVVVRVNDRGPFVHNRVIDLSYAAAIKLDMIRDGTSLVEVTAISFDEPAGDRPTRETTPPAPETAARVDSPRPAPQTPAPQKPAPRTPALQTPAKAIEADQIYVQVGAFSERVNAERRLSVLESSGIDNAFILVDYAENPALLRVRIGPVADVIQYDVLVEELENIGIMNPYLIVE